MEQIPRASLEKNSAKEILWREEMEEHVKEVEHLPLGMQQRAELILVLLGLKPATNLRIYNHNGPLHAFKNTLEKAGLYVKIMEREKFSKNVVQECAVSLDEKNAEKLSSLSPAKDHEEFGRLMGFPETAIHAFLHKEELLEREAFPKEKDIIFRFGLSKKNWEEEIAVLRRWSAAIKEYAPDLFEELQRHNGKI